MNRAADRRRGSPRRIPFPISAAALAVVAWFVGGGSLRYAEDRAPATVNPLFGTTMSEARLAELVFDGLFADDQELRSAGRLAESFEIAPDKKSMTITLRKGVNWHDGSPFGALDVVFSIDAYKNGVTASTEAGRVAWIQSAKALGDNLVQINFVAPEFAPQDKLHFKILPAHRFASPAVKRTDPFRTQPIGTGPFKLSSFKDDGSISLERSSGHWAAAKIDEMVMREVPDKNYQAKLLLFESLEALVRVLPRDLATLQNDRRIELYPYQTNSWWYFGYNLRRAPFKDAKLREALSRMVDVDALLAPIGTGDRVSGPFVPSSPFYNHAVAPVPFDADGAADILTKAGYTFNGKWFRPDGKELKIKLVAPSNLETAQDLVINLQSQLQSRGVTVEPEFLDVAAWKERVWKNNDFDLILSQWSFDRNEDIWEVFHGTGALNFTGYKSPAVDKLLQQARAAGDPQQKKATLQQAHAAIAADHPMIFLWTLDSYAALSTKVKSVVVHPFYFFTWSSDWTIGP